MLKKLFLIVAIFTSSILLNAQYIIEPEFNEKVYIELHGDPKNEAIVFVHGLGDEASTTWTQTMHHLKEKYYILTFDLPGFGKSTKSNQVYSPKRYTTMINNIASYYIDKKFHLVGHSMGGAVALMYTSQYQSKVKSLTLIDAAGILNRITYSNFLANSAITNYFGSKVDSVFPDFLSDLPQAIDSFLPLDMNMILNSKTARKLILRSSPSTIASLALVQADFSTVPQNIEVRTNIIWGEDDTIAPLRTGYSLAKLMPNSKLDIISNSKHVPIVDSYDRYFSSLTTHLNSKDYKFTPNKIEGQYKDITLSNQNNITISGKISNLELHNCKNITIKNAIINKLTVTNSTINVLHSILYLKDKSYIVDSEFLMTASDVELYNDIEFYDSKIDFAAVTIDSGKYFFVNLNYITSQDLLFSLSSINGVPAHGKIEVD